MIGLEYIVKEFHIGYKEVAHQLGISPQTIQDWLKNRRSIPKKRLEQLSTTFNLPMEFFQKELNSIEKREVTISYLKSISKNIEIPVSDEEEQFITYYHTSSYEDEINFIEENLKKKKKQLQVKNELKNLFEKEILSTFDIDREINLPLYTDSSNTEAIYKMIKLLNDEKLVDYFKVIIHMLYGNSEFGGKPETAVSEEYKNFAKEFSGMLEKHKIK